MALYYLSGIGKKPKKKKKIAKILLAPARNAFLLIVKVNAFRLAKKLLKAYEKNPAGVKKFWEKFGGNWDKLAKEISRGSKVKISGEIGFPPAVASAIAAATPVLLEVKKLLKSLGLDKEPDEQPDEDLDKGIEKGKKDLENDDKVEKTTASTEDDFTHGKLKTNVGSTGILTFILIQSNFPLILSIPLTFIGIYYYVTKILRK